MFTIGINLIFLMAVPLSVFIMIQFQQTALLATYINYWSRIIPSYNVSKTLLFCGTQKLLMREMERRGNSEDFPEINFRMWSMDNNLGDLYALMAHFVFGCLGIFFFEAVVYQTIWARCMYKMCFCFFKGKK